MSQYPPTAEQQNAIDLYLTGRSLVIQAGAGTGKTSTLVFLANAAPSRRCQFIAFNRSIVEDARKKFPRNVQCQPDGTLVCVPVSRGHEVGWEEVPIETIQDGDRVVSLNLDQGAVARRRGTRALVSKRPYKGPLVVASTAGNVSRYTPEHPCMVDLADAFNGRWLLYIMRRGSHFRSGIAAWKISGDRNGLMRRVVQEGADAVWIITAHDSKEDALLAEALLQYEWQVPGWRFREVDGEPLTHLWDRVETNSAQGAACLASFGRDVDSPLWAGGDSMRFGQQAQVVAAANLMDGMRMLAAGNLVNRGPFGRQSGPRHVWTPVVVSRDFYEGTVTSLTLDRDHTYFADGILTHNCSTAHSLAVRSIRTPDFEARQKNGKRMRTVDIANRLRVEALRVDNDGEQKLLSSTFLAGLALRGVTRFCQSADATPGYRHVPRVKALSDEANRAMARHLEPVVRRAWSDLSTPEGGLPFTTSTAFAVYLKLWQLSRPVIGADVILYDESQDASPVMVDVVALQADPAFRAQHGLLAAQLVWVGDSCQPAGTLVQRVRTVGSGQTPTVVEEVPIEQIREGDLVVSYDVSTGHLHRRGNRVLGVSERAFTGRLVQIDAGLKWVSNYTPDHHCVAKLGPAFKGKHLVYLMRRAGTGESYRIGRAAGSYTSGFGPLARAKAEGADALWILSVHETAAEAATAEALASHRFGIPMMLFRAATNRLLSQDSIEEFWSRVGDLTRQASECLADHGREMTLPLWQPGDSNLLMTRATKIRACNLMSGMEVPVVAAAEVEWATAKVRSQSIAEGDDGFGRVYSMTVANDHTYVGDGIVTHNCQQIYGFTGAINALETVPSDEEAFLTQSFRFGQAIADVANHVLALIPSARLRLTGRDDRASVVAAVAEPDAILTRTNATAVRKVFETVAAGRRPHLVGGGEDVIYFAEASADLMAGIRTDHPELACFEDWDEVVQYVAEDEQGGDLKLLVDLINEFGVQEIIAALKGQPTEADADLVVSTAHKSKGREWDTVQIAADFPEDRLAKGGDEAVDELRLLYVAVTRAKMELDITGLAFLANGVAPNPVAPPVAPPVTPRVRTEAKRSEHVGTVGGPIEVEAGCVSAKGMTTRFGYTYLTTFVTADGNVLKAFLDQELEAGTIYRLSARVKAHGEFKGVAETTINYVDHEETSGAVGAPEAPVGVRVEA